MFVEEIRAHKRNFMQANGKPHFDHKNSEFNEVYFYVGLRKLSFSLKFPVTECIKSGLHGD